MLDELRQKVCDLREQLDQEKAKNKQVGPGIDEDWGVFHFF